MHKNQSLLRSIRLVLIHCTDSDSPHYDLEAIRDDHKSRGWSDIGYHYLIDQKGSIHLGRDESVQGAHVKGFNKSSIGIALMGKKTFSIIQFQSLLKLCIYLQTRYKLEAEDFLGHCELDENKTCPNFNVNTIRAKLVRYS